MPNRCGAKGIVVQKENVVGVKIISLESEMIIRHRHISLQKDISVGEFIPMKNLFEEHRGIIIFDKKETIADEGEIWPVAKGTSTYKFVSDFGDKSTEIPVEYLVGLKVRIKPEIFDQVGAARRLKEIKKSF